MSHESQSVPGTWPSDNKRGATNALYSRMETWSPYILSILRIVAALLFLQHGLSKVFSFPVPGPPLHGLLVLAAFLEVVGSLMLLAGVFTRIVAFILSGEMAFAYFMAHAPRSFYPIANQGEAAILFCFVFLYIAFAGGGPWSVDRAVLKQG
jgi:putative oxidoreductase